MGRLPVSDEAQAVDHDQPATLPEPLATEAEPYEFSIEVRFDATVDVDGHNWIKPGASTRKTWRIRDGVMPSRREVELTLEYMKVAALEPTLDELIQLIFKRVDQAQMGR